MGSACRECGWALPDGNGLGLCPHGDKHTECCLRVNERRLDAERWARATQPRPTA